MCHTSFLWCKHVCECNVKHVAKVCSDKNGVNRSVEAVSSQGLSWPGKLPTDSSKQTFMSIPIHGPLPQRSTLLTPKMPQ